ncbi:conjugal transfer protein TraD [Mesorhizobium opportunistum]|uniref:conjugal transfer protein TraD n=1 Tax=Mesorhizobium opportunistum TaxID=593909 RepID=UPI003337375B
MRTWQIERRKRTRHLIELGGLVLKAGIIELTNDNRAAIYGALIWIAAKLQSHEGEHAQRLWTATGRQAFDAEWRGDQKSQRTEQWSASGGDAKRYSW